MTSSLTVAVVGGHGQIARLLHPLLIEAGHTPVALVRKTEHAEELGAEGVTTRMLDIEADDAAGFAAAFEGCQAVVFAAGGGGDGSVERKRTVDFEGSVKSIQGAAQAGATRFVQISAISVDDPAPDDSGDAWKAYVKAKSDADAALRDSDLDWTIVRPGALTDDAATGRVQIGAEVERSEVPRGDVAAVIAAALVEDASIRKQFNLVSGETPVAEAVAGA